MSRSPISSPRSPGAITSIRPRLADLGARTFTAQGIPGDVINVGLEGSGGGRGLRDDRGRLVAVRSRHAGLVAHASRAASAFRRPYHRAPVSPLFFDGRKQDLAFEKPSGRSASTRHHVRFWKALEAGDDGRPVWLGAATFDDGVGVSHYTGQITHHVGAGHRRGARFSAGQSRRGEEGRGDLLGQRRRPDAVRPERRRRPFLHRRRDRLRQARAGLRGAGGRAGRARPAGQDRGEERRVLVARRACGGGCRDG